MPGIWDTPVKAKTLLKGFLVFLAGFVVVVCALEGLVLFSMTPPKESKLIADFQAHRAAYERLREMLLADQQIEEVSKKGIKTSGSLLLQRPSDLNFPLARYQEYMTLLSVIGRDGIFKGEEKQAMRACVIAWGAGWAGDTRHSWVCWADREPTNQVASLDDYYKNPNRPRYASRHIDGNWYLTADW